jgi:phosphoribosylpyrophosphate synthetase
MGVDKIITLDLHANAVAGCVSSKTVFEDYEAAFTAIDFFTNEIKNKSNLCIVAPDAGAAKRAKSFHSHFEQHDL